MPRVIQGSEIMTLYNNGYRYDAMFHGDSGIEFIKKEAGKTKGPLLELCCGTGRLLLPLLKAGFECTGIDYSHDMISVAEERISKEGYSVDLIVADASSFDLGKTFASIIVCSNSIGRFTTYKQIIGLLNCVSGHMASDGIFIIDVYVPAMGLLLGRDKEELELNYTDPESKETIELWESYSYDTATQIETATWRSVKEG